MIVYLLIACCVVSLLSLLCAVFACARVGAMMTVHEKADWETLLNLSADQAAVKQAIKQMNNRLNGWERSSRTELDREQLELLAAGHTQRPDLGG